MSENHPVFLTTKMLARRWQLSPRTLEGWRYRNEGPTFLIFGRRVLYALRDVEAFEAAMFQHKGALSAVAATPAEAAAAGQPMSVGPSGGRSP